MPRGSGMSVTRRRNRRPKTDDPEALAARLPDELRSFDGWQYTGALHEYWSALSGWLLCQDAPSEMHDVAAVMRAAGLSAADWFRRMLTVIEDA